MGAAQHVTPIHERETVECERESSGGRMRERSDGRGSSGVYVMPMHERETAECEREAMDVAAAERERERESDGLEMQTR